MADLLISGIFPRTADEGIHPRSVLEHFGRPAVPGCWSGLYGLNATREGIKALLSRADTPQAVFRVVCRVPGGIVTHMTADSALEMEYLNVRYADAALKARLRDAWREISGDADDDAMLRHPHRVRDVLTQLGLGSLPLVLHPFSPADSNQVFTAGTVLDPSAIIEIRCRQREIEIRIE
ncbi:hypothetical protein ACS8Y6_05895 [Salinisphaera sp. RV14]|uniref:hypothetical protein n=1 Tax=unclassified Salinisphaera TaxID=2649847 RepID=UPI003F83BE25